MFTARTIIMNFVLFFSAGTVPIGAADAKPAPMLSHIVFFKLNEATEENADALVESCKKHLSGHRGTLAFYAGRRAGDYKRDVNDTDFDVTLHILFRNEKAHKTYQTHPRHLAFIEENKESWKSVRVFDSLVAPMPRPVRQRPDRPQAKRLPLPDQASFFAGMIKAEVVAQRGRGVVVTVKEILKSWKQSKAKEPEAMKEKKLLILPRPSDKRANPVARFLKTLKKGDVVSLDVAHKQGEALIVVELTEEQRKKVGVK